MQDSLEPLKEEVVKSLAGIEDLPALVNLRAKYLGKTGVFTEMLKGLSTLSKEERPKQGAVINQAKKHIQTLIEDAESALKEQALEKQLASESIDVTLPGRGQSLGSLHPVTLVRQRAVRLFSSLGFVVEQGPEIESEFNNFTALNIPDHHPARAELDTFYFGDGTLLRTHTSSVQIRTMTKQSPPLRIITPGRVYRRDSDVTHTPMFHQLEGLVVNTDCNFANLKHIIQEFINRFFEKEVTLRFRPSYFPFTEPSAEVDIAWASVCEGADPDLWLEVLGCGMVHPNVFSQVGIDAEQYNGYAFGVGLDRLAMLLYGIQDLRLFFENDLQFLSQFD